MTRISPETLSARKAAKDAEKIVCLTAYTAPFTRIFDSHADLLLVGDSLGMVLYGMPTTREVDLDMMIRHAKAVVRSSQRACIIVDMPFGTYEDTPAQALESARRIMAETGAQGVKLEGGREMEEIIAALCSDGIPVMGHAGLLPQGVTDPSGYKVRGRDAEQASHIRADVAAITRAGAFAVVLEAVAEPLARDITTQCPIPMAGIGASPSCDGQILVGEDMLGLTPDPLPRFGKRFADLSAHADKGVQQYARTVREGTFPGPDHVYTPPGSKESN